MGEAARKQAAALKVAAAYEGEETVDLSDPFYSEGEYEVARGV